MRLLKSLRANILVGIVLTIPVVATVLIFDFLFRLATNWLPDNAFPRLQVVWNGYLLRFITLIAVLIFFYITGLLVRNFLGRRLYGLGDRILGRIPLIKNIYVTVRQVSASLFTQRKGLFKEVVLIQYPRKGLYSLAFITATAPENITQVICGGNREPTQDCVSVFIATTPNPTSGVFILVPRAETVPLQVSVPDALTFIMSAGAVHPGQTGVSEPTLLDKLEIWLSHRED
jgi:uncharacterized membrane protein